MTGVTGTSSIFNAYTARSYASQRNQDDEMLSKILSESDANEDGTIDADEIAALDDEQKIAFLLNADSDGDGNVTEAELTEVLAQKLQQMQGGMMPPPPPPSAEDMLAKIMDESDTDGDGAITTEEIAALDEQQQSLLLEADADSDGIVTEEELSALLQSREPVSMTDFKQQLADAIETSDGQSTEDSITNFLSDLGATTEQIDDFMQLLQGARFDIRA